MAATLNIWRDRFIFTAPGMETEASCRPAIAILVGTRGPITITTDSGASCSGRALLVGPNVPRTLRAADAGLYSLNLDPVHRSCRYLRNQVLAGREVVDLSAQLDAATLRQLATTLQSPGDCANSYRSSELLLAALFPPLLGIPPIDPRIEMVAFWLMTHTPRRPDATQLAALCGLSEGRLTHLFTEQLGLSIRNYLHWVKMRKATELLGQEMSLTAVAHAIGFADSSHLSRTFKEFFSLTPSFLSNAALVRFKVCDNYEVSAERQTAA
ncbi:MAG TPA: AraC family transcriptional regulator [Solimonas sp.]|nr:AraC family transcriptional regulator [Solimonas sp.]